MIISTVASRDQVEFEDGRHHSHGVVGFGKVLKMHTFQWVRATGFPMYASNRHLYIIKVNSVVF
jgi:hypothetical protein